MLFTLAQVLNRVVTRSEPEDEDGIPPEEFDRKRSPIATGYVRDSTGKQVWGVEAQKSAIMPCYQSQLSETHDWYPGPGRFFVDRGESARKETFRSRPAGQRLDEILGKGDAIIIAKMDRAFRNIRDQVLTMEDWMERGITIYSASEGWNTGNSAGKFLDQLMGLFAEQESNRMAERVHEAAIVAKENGQPVHRAPMGFRWAGKKGEKFLTRYHGERYVMGKIVEWRREGTQFDHIVLHLDHKRITSQYRKDGPVQHWSKYSVVKGYWCEMFIRWLEQNGADFRSPDVICVLSGAYNHRSKDAILTNREFRSQLEAEVII